MTEAVGTSMRPYRRHVFICYHGDCAAEEAGERLRQRFAQLSREHGLNKLRNPERVKCSLADCLGVCTNGPILVVYPDGIWYHHVDEAALERIFHQHILKGQPVEELVFHQLAVGGPEGGATVPQEGAGDVEAGAEHTTERAAGSAVGSTSPAAAARRAAARQAKKKKGLVIVNTGTGKGKTTAALGILMRAWGRGMRLGGVQFFKHANANFGEIKAARQMSIDLTPMGDGFTWTSRDLDETQSKALHGWEMAKQKIASEEYDIFLLDEFTYVMHYGWLDVNEVVAWLCEHKPPMMHLIITGRYAPPELIAYADLATEMRLIKHPLEDQGIRAQPGIEF